MVNFLSDDADMYFRQPYIFGRNGEKKNIDVELNESMAWDTVLKKLKARGYLKWHPGMDRYFCPLWRNDAVNSIVRP